MARVKRAVHSKKHRRATLERAKGYYGNKSRSYRAANEQVMHSLQYAFRDRRARKGEFRKLWIARINAACRINGISYSRFINGLTLAEVVVDRKVLADLAVTDAPAFSALVKVVTHGRVTQNQLGRMAAMDPATIQGVVRRLVARGLVARALDPMDRRTAVLTPTEAGLALAGRGVAHARRASEAALAPLEPAERRTLLALLARMA